MPSNSEKNPRGDDKEHVKAVMLRSGRELATWGPPPVVREEETEISGIVQPERLKARGAAPRGEASKETTNQHSIRRCIRTDAQLR